MSQKNLKIIIMSDIKQHTHHIFFSFYTKCHFVIGGIYIIRQNYYLKNLTLSQLKF